MRSVGRRGGVTVRNYIKNRWPTSVKVGACRLRHKCAFSCNRSSHTRTTPGLQLWQPFYWENVTIDLLGKCDYWFIGKMWQLVYWKNVTIDLLEKCDFWFIGKIWQLIYWNNVTIDELGKKKNWQQPTVLWGRVGCSRYFSQRINSLWEYWLYIVRGL